VEARGHVGFSGVDPGLRGRHVRRFSEWEGSRLDLSAPAAAVAALLRKRVGGGRLAAVSL
jgi:hypothetical protein